MGDQQLRFALALVEGRLHTAVGDKRCGCGPCAHWVAVAARRPGIPRARPEEALLPSAKPEPSRRSRTRGMRVRLTEHASVRVSGGQGSPSEGLAAFLAQLHDSANRGSSR